MAKTARSEDDIAKEREQFEGIRAFMKTCTLATLRDLANSVELALEFRTPKKRAPKDGQGSLLP